MAAASHSFTLFLAFLFFFPTEAKEFLVGGDASAWSVPSSATSEPLNGWAGTQRFQVGDTLVWKYDNKKDSVLQVSREAYLSCDKSRPVAEHSDGNTSAELTRSGPYYFIGGAEGACEKGEKLIVVVMSRRHRHTSSPAPSPAESGRPGGRSNQWGSAASGGSSERPRRRGPHSPGANGDGSLRRRG